MSASSPAAVVNQQDVSKRRLNDITKALIHDSLIRKYNLVLKQFNKNSFQLDLEIKVHSKDKIILLVSLLR
jgi:hypothetical protein